MSVSEIVKAINGYSPTQIATLETALATRRAQLQQNAENARAESAKMLARMTQLVAEAGLTVSAPQAIPAPVIVQSAPKNGTHRKAKRGKFKSKVLFRDPSNHKRTWSGRGPQPQWMKGDREQYRVSA